VLGATAACAAFADGHDAPQCAIIGLIREILGAGTFFNIKIFGDWFTPITIFINAPQCAQSPERQPAGSARGVPFASIFLRMIFMPATRKPSTRKA